LDIAIGWIWTMLLAGFEHCYWLDLDGAIGSIWMLLWPIWTSLVTISELSLDLLEILDLQVSDSTPVWCAQHFPEFVAIKAQNEPSGVLRHRSVTN
jgi:hypothetical protein